MRASVAPVLAAAASLIGIAFFSSAAMLLIRPPAFDEAVLNGRIATALIGFLLMMSALQLATVRAILLPALLRLPSVDMDQVVGIGYMFAVAPAVYGVVSVVFSDRQLWMLPFTVLALTTWLVVWSYFRALGKQRPSS